jgi:hypothetical protein
VLQLVGLNCTVCTQRISCDLDGRFCTTCGCPVHHECIKPISADAAGARCAACGTPAAVLRELADLRHAAQDEQDEARERLRPTTRPVAAAGQCPNCGLINPPSAQRCDCGFDFHARSMRQSYLSARARGQSSAGTRAVGIGCLAVGILLSLSGLVTFTLVGLRGAPGGTADGSVDSAGSMGFMCGSMGPGIMAVGVGAYLLRSRR